MKSIKFDHYSINEDSKPFVIAEIGVNYYEISEKEHISLTEAAKKMIKTAADSGADAVKFQSYKAEKLASVFSPSYWDTSKEVTKSQYELFRKYDTFEEKDYCELSNFSKRNNIVFLSTPFDYEAVDFLDYLLPVFKISSSDITNIPFIRYIAQKQKPIFLSTGASTIPEINEAVRAIEDEGNNKIVLFHCILNYPTLYRDANLNMILNLKKEYPDYFIGYSDHTLPDSSMLVLTTAVLLGAKVIEKHFTLDKTLPGNDHYHAMDPHDLKVFIHNLSFIQEISGQMEKKPLESEMPARMYARRSIVAKRDIPKDTIISEDLIEFKRPGTGVSPNLVNRVIGKKAKKMLLKDEIIQEIDLYIN